MSEEASAQTSDAPPAGDADNEGAPGPGAGETQVLASNSTSRQIQSAALPPQGQGTQTAGSQGQVPPVQPHDSRLNQTVQGQPQGQPGQGDSYPSAPHVMPPNQGWPTEQMQLVLSLDKK